MSNLHEITVDSSAAKENKLWFGMFIKIAGIIDTSGAEMCKLLIKNVHHVFQPFYYFVLVGVAPDEVL